MMDLRELVFALNEYLGRDKFSLFLGTNGAPSEDDDRIVCTANIGVVPYGYTTDEIDATSLNITFTFDLPCGTVEDDFKRDEAILLLTDKLLNWKQIYLQDVGGESYFLNTFFEMLPMGQPYVDDGRITQQLVVSGKALLQHLDCNAIVGNNEELYIDDERVLVVDKSSSMQVTHEPSMKLSQDSYVPDMVAMAYAQTLSVTCLYRGTAIDKAMWAVGEGVLADPNKVYIVKSVLKAVGGALEVFNSEKRMKLISVTNSTSVGTFIRYQAVFQMVE